MFAGWRFVFLSAQRTFENSAAIYRWELDHGSLFRVREAD